MVDYEIPGDSIFLSVISQLKGMLTLPPTLQDHLCSLGISLADFKSNDMKIAQALWEIVVNELLSNAGRYKHTLLSPDRHFEEEVNKWKECGYFSSKYTPMWYSYEHKNIRTEVPY